MSWIQQLEEEQYDNQTEYLDVLRAEAYDPYADDIAWYCEDHDFEAYNQTCPQCDELAEEQEEQEEPVWGLEGRDVPDCPF